MRAYTLSIVAVFILFSASIGMGQGFTPDGMFQHFDVDHVEAHTRGSVIDIPLLSYKQRGTYGPLTFSIVANTPNYRAAASCSGSNCFYSYAPYDTNLGYGVDIISSDDVAGTADPNFAGVHVFQDSGGQYQQYETDYVVDHSGAQHKLWRDSSNSSLGRTIDGSAYLATYNSNGVSAVYDRRGRKQLGNGWVDQDGNQVTRAQTYSTYIDSWTDTVGRSIPGPFSGGYSTNVSDCAPAPPGAPAPVRRYSWTPPGNSVSYIICLTTVNIHTNFWGAGPGQGYVEHTGDGNCDNGICGGVSTESFVEIDADGGYVVQSVKLPNGTAWRFVYDSAPDNSPNVESYGTITRIIEPTGGSIYYCYATSNMLGQGVQSANGDFNMRYITTRVVDSTTDPTTGVFSCSSPSTLTATQSKWTYSLPAGSEISTTITGPATPDQPNGNDSVISFPSYSSTFTTGSLTLTDSYYQGTGSGRQLLKTVTRGINRITLPKALDPGDQSPEAVSQNASEVTAEDGQTVASTSTSPDGGFTPSVVTCIPNTTTCTTHTTSATGLDLPVTVGNSLQSTTTNYKWVTDSTIASANLMDLPQSIVVSDSSSSSETDYSYDDSGYYSGTGKGHLTKVTRINNVGANVVTYSHFNSYGAVDQTYDGNGTQASAITFDPTYHLYPSSIQYPLIGSESFSYGLDTGLLQSHTDVNGEATSYTYDSANRPLTIRTPDATGSGYTSTVCYPAANQARIFQAQALSATLTSPSSDGTTCSSQVTNDTIVTKVIADGLGRITDKILETAPEGQTYSSTQYDSLDRAYKVSNPYLSSGSPVWTSSHFDGIGRLVQVSNPDSTSRTTSYSGLTSTITDEASHSRNFTKDLLGRTTQVNEPNVSTGALNVVTQYAYGVYGLTGVTQSGVSGETARTRSFNYDSLSRLITSTNPETGTICYGTWSGSNCVNGYDGNSNLLHKTDARGVTVNYSYDVLNRMVSKTYSNDSSNTLSSCYQYGTSSSGSATSNLIGRLIKEWTQSGSCPSSPPSTGYVTLRSILAYDQVGRLTSETQCSLGQCTNGVSFSFSYGYDLTGKSKTATNGLGTVSWQPAYDAAGRLQEIDINTAWFNPSGSTRLFGGTTYNSTGLTDWSIGPTGSPALTLHRTYDQRMRVQTETVTGQH